MDSSTTITKHDWMVFILSALAIIIFALAGFLRYIGFDVAIEWIVGILAANGLVGATKWQAAPGLIAALQKLLEQVSANIPTNAQTTSTQTVTTRAYIPTGTATQAPSVPGVPPRASAGPDA